jgi:hypothetical protein
MDKLKQWWFKRTLDWGIIQFWLLKPKVFSASTHVKMLHAMRVFFGYYGGMQPSVQRIMLKSTLQAILVDLEKL